MNLQLFQEYGIHASNKVRFHMQRDEENKAHIMDKQTRPQIYLALESELSDAIFETGSID